MEPKSIVSTKKDGIYLSHQSSRKSITNSVKTPALLFYKPSQTTNKKSKGDYENLHGRGLPNTRNYNDYTQIVCENHQSVAAKFYSTTDEQQQRVFYCDKCARLLQDQGFKVTAINCGSYGPCPGNERNKKPKPSIEFPYPERQFQIRKFLENLNDCQMQLGENNNQIRQILIDSEQFYGHQIEEINEYFQNIIQSLELEKNKCYNHILLERQNAEKQTRELMRRLTEGEKEITSMMADIQDNLDSVYSISWQNYKLVMDTFDGRLNEVFKLIQEVKINGIADVEYRKIEFAGVPQSINSLSEIIIQNSYGSVNYTDGSLLLTEGSSGSFQRGRQIQEISEIQVSQQSIFEKFRKELNQQSGLSNAEQNHMMFSFDGQRMRSQNSEYSNNGVAKQNKFSESNSQHMEIKLRKNRFSMMEYGQIQKVQGIKQVQQLDVIVMDEDLLQPPVGLKLVR